MTYNPKPLKIKKARKPLDRIGKVGRGNAAFTQQMLEAWFTSALLKNGAHARDGNGSPMSVMIETADGYEAWIKRDDKGRYTGTNVQVAHIRDKSTDPKLRWDPRNVAPLTPYNNQRMKYDLEVRETMQVLMKAWVLLNLGPA